MNACGIYSLSLKISEIDQFLEVICGPSLTRKPFQNSSWIGFWKARDTSCCLPPTGFIALLDLDLSTQIAKYETISRLSQIYTIRVSSEEIHCPRAPTLALSPNPGTTTMM